MRKGERRGGGGRGAGCEVKLDEKREVVSEVNIGGSYGGGGREGRTKRAFWRQVTTSEGNDEET